MEERKDFLSHSEVNRQVTEIKNLIRKGNLGPAIEKMNSFISMIDDEELEAQIINISSRFERIEKDKRSGTFSDASIKELNELTSHLTDLWRVAKGTAIEKATDFAGSQLSKLTEEGSSAIEELRKLNYIIAESKLLELDIIRSYLGILFPSEKIKQFEESIKKLKEILNKQEEENLNTEINPDHLFMKIQEIFPEKIINSSVSEEELRLMMQRIINITKAEKGFNR